MKSILLTLALCAFTIGAQAQSLITIAEARTQPDSSAVRVVGTVLNGADLGKIRYIQDGSGSAIAVYSPVAPLINLVPGDSIEVIGAKVTYRNLIEIVKTNAIPLTINQLGQALNQVQPVQYAAADMASVFTEPNEGKLVRINGLTAIVPASGTPATTFAANTNYNLNGDPTYQLRSVIAAVSIVGSTIPTTQFDVIGILSQFCVNPAVGCATGYQLLPRTSTDIIVTPTSIAESILKQIKVYPNPTTVGSIRINSADPIFEVSVVNSIGQTMDAVYQDGQVKLGTAPAGLYTLKFRTRDLTFVKQFSVQ
jgi:hypothetical protein